MNEFDLWLTRVTNGTSQRGIASDMGIQNTALSRWIRNESIPAEKVIDIARHYKASIYDGLHAAGYINAEDVVSGNVDAGVRQAATRALIEELLRRAIKDEELKNTPEQAIEAMIQRAIEKTKGDSEP